MNRLDDAVRELLPTVPTATAVDRLRDRVRRRRRRRAVSIVAIVGMIAVASVGLAAAAGHKSSAPLVTVSPPTVATVPVTSAVSTSSTVDNAPSVCAHTAISTQSNYYAVPPPSNTSIDYFGAHGASDQTAAVTDRRGDTIRTVGAAVKEIVPNGTVSLVHPGTDVHLRDFGDFDGDGRTDLLVEVIENFAVVDVYIVRGQARPGVYDPVTVGSRVPDPDVATGDDSVLPRNVGDQDRDGADDLVVGVGVYSGRALTLHPTASLPAPIRTLPARYLGLLQLTAASAPIFVLPQLPLNAVGELEVLDARNDRLDVGGGPLSRALDPHATASVTGWLVNGHHIVELSWSDRGGGQVWRFDLDQPCGS